MAEQLDYLYSGIANDKMLTGAETMHDLFAADVADFTALDADLDDAFGNQWLDDIDEARDFPTDESVVDEIGELTEVVNTAWENCRNHFQDAKYFIEKAFPGNTAIHKTFGYDDYKDMSRLQDKVLPFMDQFHDKAEKHKVVLIAEGYTQAKIDAIETLAAAYRTANRNQEKAKKDRLETTQNRAKAHNKVWASVQRINKASKTIYRNDYAKLQQYLLPAAASNEAPEHLSAIGTVTDSVTGLAVTTAVVALPDLGLTSNVDDAGQYAFAAGTPAGNTPIITQAPTYNDNNDTITIPATGTVTKNISLTPV